MATLAAVTTVDPRNVHAAALLYAANHAELLHLTDVVDALAARFAAGRLQLSEAGEARVRDYVSHRHRRPDAVQRWGAFQRVLGVAPRASVAGADLGPGANEAFGTRWLALLEALTTFRRLQEETSPKRDALDGARVAVSEAAEALAENVSEAAAGEIETAERLGRHLGAVLAVLYDADVQAALDVDDRHDLFRRIAEEDLGGTPDLLRLRTMARSGQAILDALADDPRLERTLADPAATDRLAADVDRWLAVNR
jgi:hypothetical protein